MSYHADNMKRRKEILTGVTLILAIPATIVISHSLFASFYNPVVFSIVLITANLPWIIFSIGISKDKAWILRVIEKEKSFKTEYYITFITTINLVYLRQPEDFAFVFYLLAAALSVFYISLILTKAMGLYIYWLARLDGEKLKMEIPDRDILEKLSCAYERNHQSTQLCGATLFLLLLMYFLSEYSVPGFGVYFAPYFFWCFCEMNLKFFSSQLYEKAVMWLQMTAAAKFLRELSAEAVPLHIT